MLNQRCFVLRSLGMAIALSGSVCCAQDASQILDRYAHSLDWQRSISSKLEAHYSDVHPLLASRATDQRDEISYCRDGDSYSFMVRTTSVAPRRIPETITEASNVVIANGQVLTDQPDLSTGKVSRVYLQKETERGRVSTLGAYLGTLSGYIAGGDGKTLIELLREDAHAQVRPKSEAIGGQECVVIDANVAEGRATVWLSPAQDYALAKLVLESGPSNRYDGEPLTEQRLSAQDGDRLVGLTISLDAVENTRAGSFFVPTRAKCVTTTKYKNGKTDSFTVEYKQSEVVLKPDLSNVRPFELKVPDGTPVTDLDHQGNGIKYKWLGGKPVVAVNEADQEKIDAGVANEQAN